MSLTDFIGVLSHRFRKVGAVCVSETYYDDPSTHVASVLLTHGQLIAIAQQYGLLVVAAPGQSATGAQGVYVAQAGSVLSAIEADRAAAEEEAADRGQEKSGRQQDLPRQDNLFKFVDVQEGPIWHLAFNSTGDFLVACTPTHLLVFSTSSLSSCASDPMIALPMDQPMVDVTWNIRTNSLELGVLLEDATFRVYEVNLPKNALQCTQAYQDKPVSAIASIIDGWAVGHSDGSLTILNERALDAEPRVIAPHQLPEDVTTADDSNGQPFGVHSIQFMSPDVLLVGLFQYAAGQEDARQDPNKINVAAYHITSDEWRDYGDVLRDEDRCHEDAEDKLYEGRHRLMTANLPALRLSVFASSKAAEVTIMGVDPDESSSQSSWPLSWWIVGESEAEQIVVPIDEDFRETYAIGLVVDTTNSLPTVPDAAAQKNGAGAGDAVPVVFMLATNGRLHCYQLMTSHPAQTSALRSIMKAPARINTVEEAVDRWRFESSLPAEDGSSPAATSEEDVQSDEAEAETDEEEEVSSTAATPVAATADATPAPFSFSFASTSAASSSAAPSFSAATSAAPTSAFAFGATTSATSNFAFGANKPPLAAPPAASPFSMDKPAASTTPFSFAPPAAAPSTTPAASPFSFNAPATSAFGATATTTAAPTTSPPAASLFGATSTPATSLFGTTAPPATSAFGATVPPATSAFGSTAPPAASAFGATALPSSGFSFSAPAPFAAPKSTPTPAANIFGAEKKATDVSTTAAPAAATTKKPVQPAAFQPAAVVEPVPAKPVQVAPPATSTMTRSIIKPAPTPAAAAPTPAPVAPYAVAKFVVDYKDADASADVAPTTIREPAASSVPPEKLESSLSIGDINDTEKNFLKAMIQVATHFKTLSGLTASGRDAIMAAQQTQAPSKEDKLNLKRVRTMTARTRALENAATQVDTQSATSLASLEELVQASKRADTKAAECQSLLSNHGDEEYVRLMEHMSLDVHSARLQQSIEKSTADIKARTAALDAHLQELYAQYDASAPPGRRGHATSVPTVKSVVGVLNTHGETIVDLESYIDELEQQVDQMRRNPPSARLDKERRKRQQLLRDEREQRAAFSPLPRLAAPARTPSKEESKEAVAGSRAAQSPFRSPLTSTPRTPTGPASSFRPSSLSALSSAFREKLRSQSSAGHDGAVAADGDSRSGVASRDLAAIHRGKSKQRLDQLFSQVEQQQAAAVPYDGPVREETTVEQRDELNETTGLQDGGRRWARTGPQAPVANVASPVQAAAPTPAVAPASGAFSLPAAVPSFGAPSKPTPAPAAASSKPAPAPAAAFSFAAASEKPKATEKTTAPSFGGGFGFGASTGAASTTNMFGSSTTSATASSLFGASTSSSSTNSGFGATASANPFGATTPAPAAGAAPSGFSFAATTPAVKSPSVEKKASATATDAKPSLFGAKPATSDAAPSLFGAKPDAAVPSFGAKPATGSETSPFKAPAFSIPSVTSPTASLSVSPPSPLVTAKPTFGAAAATSPAEVKSPSAVAPVAAKPAASLFGATTSTPASSVFGAASSSAASTTAAPATSLFGSTPAPTSAFGASTSSSTTSSLFGASASSSSLFGGATSTGSSSSLFGASTSASLFGATASASASSTSTSLFGATPTGLFGATTTESKPAAATTTPATESAPDAAKPAVSVEEKVKSTPSTPQPTPSPGAAPQGFFGQEKGIGLLGALKKEEKAKEPSPQTGGLFGATSSAFGASSTTGASTTTSLFGAGAASTTAASSSLFGSTPAPTSVFGAAASVPATSSSLFGATTSAASSSLFGASTSAGSSSSLFGASTSASLFGATPAASTTSAGLFGATPAASTTSTATPAPAAAATTGTSGSSGLGLFGSSLSLGSSSGSGSSASSGTTGASLFGPTPTGGLFGATPSAIGTPSNLGGGSLFGAAPAAATPAAATSTNLFGAPATPAPATGGGLFGTPAAAAAPTGGLFGTTSSQPGASSNLFGSTPSNLFGGSGTAATTAAPATGGLFGNPVGSLFGQSSTSTPAAAPLGGNIFGTASTSAAPATNAFGSAFGSSSGTTASGSNNPFAAGAPASSPFGGAPAAAAPAASPFGGVSQTNPLGAGFGRSTFGAGPTMGVAPATGVAPSVAQLAFGGGGGIGGMGGFGSSAFGSSAPAFGSGAPAFGSASRPGAAFGTGSSGGSVFGGGGASGGASGFGSLASGGASGFGAVSGGGFGGAAASAAPSSGFGGGGFGASSGFPQPAFGGAAPTQSFGFDTGNFRG